MGISLLFQEIANFSVTDSAHAFPYLVRAYGRSDVCKFYVGFERRTRRQVVLMEFSRDIRLPRFEDKNANFSVARIKSEAHQKDFLVFELKESKFHDIFCWVAEQGVESVGRHTVERQAVQAFFDVIYKYRSFFDQVAIAGLNREERIGLYGELFVLKSWLDQNPIDINRYINAWKGPDGKNQDFIFEDETAVEVKSTVANNPDKVVISNIMQLEKGSLHHVLLEVLSFQMQEGTDATLTSLVADIRLLLQSSDELLALFDAMLIKSRYADLHASLYSQEGYFLRKRRTFRVDDKFPRILPSQIPNGVTDLKFSILLASLAEFEVKPSSAN